MYKTESYGRNRVYPTTFRLHRVPLFLRDRCLMSQGKPQPGAGHFYAGYIWAWPPNSWRHSIFTLITPENGTIHCQGCHTCLVCKRLKKVYRLFGKFWSKKKTEKSYKKHHERWPKTGTHDGYPAISDGTMLRESSHSPCDVSTRPWPPLRQVYPIWVISSRKVPDYHMQLLESGREHVGGWPTHVTVTFSPPLLCCSVDGQDLNFLSDRPCRAGIQFDSRLQWGRAHFNRESLQSISS